MEAAIIDKKTGCVCIGPIESLVEFATGPKLASIKTPHGRFWGEPVTVTRTETRKESYKCLQKK